MNTPGRRLLSVVALGPDAAAQGLPFREVKTVQRKSCLSVSSVCLLIRSSMDVRSGSKLRTLVNLPVSSSHAYIRGLVTLGQVVALPSKLIIFRTKERSSNGVMRNRKVSNSAGGAAGVSFWRTLRTTDALSTDRLNVQPMQPSQTP